ncbi:hypothetical protein OV208_40515 [Corallococcus sp. bb12-1]|uniref:hypothetical protein n=1 Tax=Corallococcus sp. bb12-1 TaxID=2996784 RepID=UPI002271E4D9|nr:hypothetical protein [Corallococcus sp. bb12-1]MCY1047652.1 hypothetical protein [Corallococcus sp. bb12-1]
MCAEVLSRAWGLLSLALLLTTGCVTLPPRTGVDSWAHGPRPTQVLWNTAGGVAEQAPSLVEPGSSERLGRRRGPKREQGSNIGGTSPEETAGEEAFTCGGQERPSGWPDLSSSQEVLAPFLACASPAEFVAMQQGVDMPRLVESLKDWDAVRLGALGPLDGEASKVLNGKRAGFLVTATEKYGVPLAEVFALFLVHAAFDDELREVLQRLARDKQLGETLGSMPTVREELQRRGLKLSDFPERTEQFGDVLRGLGRAGRDALVTIPVVAEPLYTEFSAKRGHLPPPYQEALDAVERALVLERFTPGNMALGTFDHLTFGVPMGFFHLVAGAGQGAQSLAQGRYEQATRELAPAALMVALYARGTGTRLLPEALSAEGLKRGLGRLQSQLGVEAARDLFRYLQAGRENALFAAQSGEAGLLALYEAKGSAAKAQALLAEASRERPGPQAGRSGGAKEASTVAARVHEAAGFEREAVEARWTQWEQEAPGRRLTSDVRELEKQRPSLEAPQPGAEAHSRWGDYVGYFERRVAELKQGAQAKGPLTWRDYHRLRGSFAKGMEFERAMVVKLRRDAALPRGQRKWLQGFNQPRIETHVGVAKADLRFADVLVIEMEPTVGQPPRVETFSFKSRDLRALETNGLEAQLKADASAALRYYGETLNIRRRTLQSEVDGLEVQVQRVRLIYEGGAVYGEKFNKLNAAAERVRMHVKEVEISFE